MTKATQTIQRSYDPGFQPAQAKQLADSIYGLQNIDANFSLTAGAGGAQSAGIALQPGVNEFSVVASSNDSARLPPNSAGTICFVSNNGAQTAKIFSFESTGTVPTIDGTAGTTGVSLAAAKNMLLVNVGNNKWESILTA